MNARDFYVGQSGVAKKIASVEDLRAEVDKLLHTSFGELSLELREDAEPRRWEKIVYPLLGLKIPTDSDILLAYWSGDKALLTFQSQEKEWVARVPEFADDDRLVEFHTSSGEIFSEPMSDCVPKVKAASACEEFFATKERPREFKWGRA